jgi:hypothetical protein
MTTETCPRKNCDVILTLAVMILFVVGFHLGTAAHGHGRYRDQHLGTALHYADTKIDLAHTVIVGFNATETPTIQEVPVWQMAAGILFKLFGHWWGWANVVSLVFFLSCLYPLFRTVQKFYGDRTAWWSAIFLLSQALIFLYAGEAGTDGFCLSASIWFWYAGCRLLDNPVKWFIPAAAFGTLTAVSKLPFFMAIGLAVFFTLLKTRGFKVRELAALAGIGMVSGILFLWWTHYTDRAQAGAEFPLVDLRLNSAPTNGMTMTYWYFGDWHYRLNPANWLKAAWRFGGAALDCFPLAVLFFAGLAGRRINPAGKLLFASSLLTTLVFTHLVLHHYNYLMLFSPAVAILSAAPWAEIENKITAITARPGLTTIAAALVLFLALFQGLIYMRAFTFDDFPAKVSAEIAGHTDAHDKLVVVNGGWGGDELIRTGRAGLSMWDAKAFEDTQKYARLKELGFNKLVFVSESPYQNAIQVINPGQTGIPRIMAKEFVTPLVEKWPTTFADDNVIIKEIP